MYQISIDVILLTQAHLSFVFQKMKIIILCLSFCLVFFSSLFFFFLKRVRFLE